MNDQENFEIRCPANRPHTIRGIEYTSCNTIAGSYPVSGNTPATFRCSECNTWFEVNREEENGLVLTFTILGHRRYNFLQPVRVVNYE